ncbi:ACR267Cp [Eremothecium gossypii ATCC 10895]|uniref:RING-type E3 ubiquitin transferase n=1 Tax=Eremothecium gossypii (strain ATCC 10895 / CBS 109.51 / FGSC 9923 / NRRL Y-1056) TaxID=284811 RepID=Q75BK4_EREGS|nr:ACR267Cp [Eremothecium gossypii ATCC 10895]AAS51493.1 ACR267Cp [Eremothecium gossypii ATCC 10895]AEY95785.1 FACR267Cp [Eremothecium gossypii FDAG1]
MAGESQRRRGQSINSILTSFGIRQQTNELNGGQGQHVQPMDIQPVAAATGSQVSLGSNITPTVTVAAGGAGGGGNLASMLGTTPFDAEEAAAAGTEGSTNSATLVQAGVGAGAHLPITLVLGQSDAEASGNHNVSSAAFEGKDSGLASLKNVRHFIYPAVPPADANKLNIELAHDGRTIEQQDENTIKMLKDKNGLFSLRLTPFIDHSTTNNPGLFFDPIVRTAGPSSQLVIGRYTERVREAIGSLPDHFHPVVFKSKVVSRTHGVFKVDEQGNWYVRDVKSSSGTFLNQMRLAQASVMSKDYPLKDGDILQLGMDFRGGTEEIYRCVKMRVELNKSWKRRANAFNKEALARLRNLQKLTAGLEEEDCSICLCKIKPCQAIFISPCSHSWHYQCIRRLVMTQYPQFICPNCRSSCDLEASLDSEDEEEDEVGKEGHYKEEAAIESRTRSPLAAAIQEENEEDIQMLS